MPSKSISIVCVDSIERIANLSRRSSVIVLTSVAYVYDFHLGSDIREKIGAPDEEFERFSLPRFLFVIFPF